MDDLRFALRQLRKSPGFTSVVVMTLALGIGANAAIFTLVRGVLIKPLVNRDEDRLIYIRQSAPGMGQENSTWSMPEIGDLKERVKTLSEFGDFSTIAFTLIGLGAPREVNGGVVNGSYFDVMGLHPVLGRLISPEDDGPKAASVLVLTYRFWSDILNRDPSVIGKTVQLGERSATVIGVLEPCVPYPQETEIIANVASSPHHLSATMVTERTHRMTELFARLAPGTTLEQARVELRSSVRDDEKGSSGGVLETRGLSDFRQAASRPDHLGREDRAPRFARRVSARVRRRVLQCRESYSGADCSASNRNWPCGPLLAPVGARSAACCWPKVFCSAAPARRLGCGVRHFWLTCWRVTRRAFPSALSILRSIPACCGWAWRSPLSPR